MKNYLKSLIKIICFIAIISYIIFLISAVCFALGYSPWVVSYLYDKSWWFTLAIPFLIPVFCFQGPLLALYYTGVLFAILLAFWLFWCKLWREQNLSSVLTLAQLFLAVLFFVEFYYFVLALLGISYITPPFGEWAFPWYIFAITNACVHEELVTRVLLLGIPLFFVHGFQGERLRLRKYFLGGTFKLDRASFFFLCFSSLVFALAHVSGWDFYKVIPVFVTGLALGYLFLKFGLWASILFHLSFNYISVILGFFRGLLAPAMLALYSLWLFVGFVYLLKWCRKGVRFYFGA